MTATAAQALIIANGFCTWEPSLTQITGIFAYLAWKNNTAYARTVGPDGYAAIKVTAP